MSTDSLGSPLASKGELSLARREFQFTRVDFERVRKLIYAEAGISLAPAKQDMVYSRLARRLRTLGLASFDEYLNTLEAGDRAEWEVFINALTTNLTAFFREDHHFEMLAAQIKGSAQRPFRIWCAAASTGEEPYSLAMTVCEVFDSLTPPVTIVASDIDTSVLAAGRAGIYPIERVEKLSQQRLQRFFQRGTGRQNGFARVRPALQNLISFQQINLLDVRWPLRESFDAIFCRNVMIYFDKPTQYQILKRFKPLLNLDGRLYAGHSESFLHAADLFHSRGRTVYEHA